MSSTSNIDKLIKSELSPEYLISLVKERPVIWDKTLDSYKDMNEKKVAWKEICNTLFDRFEEVEEKQKHQLTKLVIRRWTYIRDTCMRAVKKQLQYQRTGHSKTVRPYIYQEQMSFLKKIMTLQPDEKIFNGHSSEDSDNADDGQKNEAKITIAELMKKKRKRKIKNVDRVRHCNENLEKVAKTDRSAENLDRHVSFFKSLLPSMTLFTDDQTLQFQAGVINLLQKVKKSYPTPECSQPESSSYDWQNSDWFVQVKTSPRSESPKSSESITSEDLD